MTGIEVGVVFGHMITVGEALSAVGTLVSVVSAVSQGRSESQAAEYNAQMNINNAAQVRLNTAENAKRQRRVGVKRQGTLRLKDNLDLLEDSALEDELEYLSIIHQGEVRASGFGSSARLDKMRAGHARTAGMVGAGGALLTGLGAVGAGAGAGGGAGSTASILGPARQRAGGYFGMNI